MTDYRLPPGMTAKNLRFIADDLRSHNFVVFASTLGSWADAIDPPEPVPVVTDEMVEAVYGALRLRFRGYGPDHRDVLRHTLEAAVKWCGWTPPPQDLTGPRAGAESYLTDRRSLDGEGES